MPVGPTGCTASTDDPLPWTVGLSYGFSDTRLVFPGQGRFRTRQWASVASLLRVLDSGLVVGGAIGALLGGDIDEIRGTDQRWTVEPGVLWSLTVGKRMFGQRPAIPFLLVVGTLSGSSTRTRALTTGATTPLHAFDTKIDLSMGWTLGEAFSPYVGVRAFGGPVLWKLDGERVFGTDLYHVSLAVGFNLSVGRRGGLFFDAALLGMRGLGGGGSVRF